jgi:hypothetical protein
MTDKHPKRPSNQLAKSIIDATAQTAEPAD